MAATDCCSDWFCGSGELGPPLHYKRLWVIKKLYINKMNYYYFYYLWFLVGLSIDSRGILIGRAISTSQDSGGVCYM